MIIIQLMKMDNMTNKNWSTEYCDLNYDSIEKVSQLSFVG